ncbi:MAG: SUMF1/EgtB/PvdO family nonheme iron enzyme [Verrucomicrobia bacterium]|nr:SUMF1/EgtB/PvdO family nonheme iron enzyme [Verrucomicrobiota bacterium]
MKASHIKFISLSISLFGAMLAKADLHEFTLMDGRTIKAEIVRYNAVLRKVDLKREDGKIVQVKSAIFVESDQRFIKEWVWTPDGMVQIPEGTNSGTDPDAGAYSLTVDAFYMDKYEVTKAEWDRVFAWARSHGYGFDNGGKGKFQTHPVQTVNWYDCVKWCNARSKMDGRTPCYTVGHKTYKTGQKIPKCNVDANGYRLPTKTEWEYAARGGLSDKRFPWGDTIQHAKCNYQSKKSIGYDTSSTLGLHPFYKKGKKPYTSPVGSFSPNNYGLYDMTGNVWEFCWDPSSSGNSRPHRGGSWWNHANLERCYMVAYGSPANTDMGLGFRTVCR